MQNRPSFVLPGQLSAQEIADAVSFPAGIDLFLELRSGTKGAARDALRMYSVLPSDDADLSRARMFLENGFASLDESKHWGLMSAVGCVLGNVVGDALGAPLEFKPVSYTCSEVRV